MDSKHLALVLAVISVASVIFTQVGMKPELSEFEAWQVEHNMKFESVFEKAYRERVFLENLAKINTHNANPESTHQEGLNQFSALTHEEFAQQYLGLVIPEGVNIVEDTNKEVIIADNIDWVAEGAVTPVKNQGQCGSCWSFSTTGALEGLSKIANGELESFSESQLVDCSGKYGNQACNGGLMDNAFKFVKDNGIVHESEYPYVAKKNACKMATGPFKISGFTDIKNCNDLASAIAIHPVSIAVDANNWQSYKSGVFSKCKTQLDHGVTLVGVNEGNWVVKNSWAAGWGEKGYIRLAPGNTCGLCNMASYPNK